MNKFLKFFFALFLVVFIIPSCSTNKSVSLINELSDKELSFVETGLGEKRVRLVQFDMESFLTKVANSEKSLRAERAELELFEDVKIQVNTTKITKASKDSINWIGKTEDSTFDNVALIISGEKVTGDIFVKNQQFVIEPTGNGIHKIIEVNQSELPEELEPEEFCLDDTSSPECSSVEDIDPSELDIDPSSFQVIDVLGDFRERVYLTTEG